MSENQTSMGLDLGVVLILVFPILVIHWFKDLEQALGIKIFNPLSYWRLWYRKLARNSYSEKSSDLRHPDFKHLQWNAENGTSLVLRRSTFLPLTDAYLKLNVFFSTSLEHFIFKNIFSYIYNSLG